MRLNPVTIKNVCLVFFCSRICFVFDLIPYIHIYRILKVDPSGAVARSATSPLRSYVSIPDIVLCVWHIL